MKKKKKKNFGLPNLTKPKKKKKIQEYNKISQHFHNTSIFNCGRSQYNILLSYFDL